MTTHHHTFLQYVNLRDIENQITTLQYQISEYKSRLSNDTYTLFEFQISYLTNKIGKVSNQLKSLEPGRVKRGLIDGLGSVVKSITGNLDYTDALNYENAIKNLQINNNKLVNEFNNHISLSKEWMAKHNNVLLQLVENQSKINSTLELLLNNTLTTGSLITYAKFGQLISIISENVEDLRLELVRIENMLAFIHASSTVHSMIDIETLRSMVNRLEQIYSKDEILSLELREYYDIIRPGSYFNEKQIVIVFRFPIISKIIYDLYKLSIVPNKNRQALIPTYPFIATNGNSFVYIEAECSKFNNWYLCEKEITHQIRTKTDCIQELIMNQALKSSCQFNTVFLEKEAMEKLDDQHYVISFPNPTQVQSVCGREDFNTLQGSYLATIPINCYLRTKELTIINDNDVIQGQPLKLMNIPYNDVDTPHAALTQVHLSSIDLRGLHSIQNHVMTSQPIQLNQLQSDVIYHTTIPFYIALLGAGALIIAILGYRNKWFCKRCETSNTKGHTYEEPEIREEDRAPRGKVPETFSLKVLK